MLRCLEFLVLMSGTLVFAIGTLAAGEDTSSASSTARQQITDAWWTGPMLAPSANTLPRGHILVEPYLFDVITHGFYDDRGVRRSSPHTNSYGSLTYALLGVTNKLSVGLIPTLFYNQVSNGPSSSGVGLGDWTVQGQYRLRRFREGSWLPTTSIAIQETLPTGKYNRLGARASDGFGSGAYTTTLALYTQTYFWLPNRRILRTRLNLTQSFSNTVKLQGVSVYGTGEGFNGRANPGGVFFVDSSWEYSWTKKWVPAIDFTFRYQANTPVIGNEFLGGQNPAAIHLNSGSSYAFALAPAIEYSWKSNIGVLLGVRIIAAGRNTSDTITPAIAINYVH